MFHLCTIVWSLSSYLEIGSTLSNEIIWNCCFLIHTYTHTLVCLLRLSKGDVQNADTRGQGCIQIYWGGHKILHTAPGIRQNVAHWSISLCHRERHIHTQRCLPFPVPLHHCQDGFGMSLSWQFPQLQSAHITQKAALKDANIVEKLLWALEVPKLSCTTLIWPLHALLDIL